MRIRWTVPAADDLGNIYHYLLNNYPQFAESTVRAIYQQIKKLKMSPNRGRPGHRSGTRELPIPNLPYIVVYAVKAEVVEILHIYHGATGLALMPRVWPLPATRVILLSVTTYDQNVGAHPIQ